MILVSHPSGNANVRGVLRGLESAGILDSFCTSIGTSDREAGHWRNFLFQKASLSGSANKAEAAPAPEAAAE
jgi:hypothetical protein